MIKHYAAPNSETEKTLASLESTISKLLDHIPQHRTVLKAEAEWVGKIINDMGVLRSQLERIREEAEEDEVVRLMDRLGAFV